MSEILPYPKPPQNISVLGLGLLGGSFCHAVRALPHNPIINGFAHNPATLASARDLGLAHNHFADIALAVANADLVVMATPIGAFENLLRQMAGHLRPGCIVTDVGSTKRSVCRLAREILPPHASFLGSHPMAGGERSGANFSRADLFHNVPVILTPEPDTAPSTIDSLDALWKSLGAWTTHLSPETHDRLVASISHAPHVTAAMLVTLQTPASLDLAGGGYRDSTRIAASNPDLWRDILIDNRDNVLASLKQLRSETEELIKFLDRSDAPALRDYLAAAAIKRGADQGKTLDGLRR